MVRPGTESCQWLPPALWNYYLLVSLQHLAPWGSFLLVTQTSLSCASEEFLLFLRIIITMTCIRFLKYWLSWGQERKSVFWHTQCLRCSCVCGQHDRVLRHVSIPHWCFRRAVRSNIGSPLYAPRPTTFSSLFTKTIGFLTEHTHNLSGAAAPAALVHIV